jgi:hypothetical protein
MRSEKEIKKQITEVLMCGKEILDCYKKHGLPTFGKGYKLFVFDATKILLKYPKHHSIGSYLEFLINNEGNTLPKNSSGSLYTALEDIDGFSSGVNYEEDDFTEECMNYFNDLYNSLF